MLRAFNEYNYAGGSVVIVDDQSFKKEYRTCIDIIHVSPLLIIDIISESSLTHRTTEFVKK